MGGLRAPSRQSLEVQNLDFRQKSELKLFKTPATSKRSAAHLERLRETAAPSKRGNCVWVAQFVCLFFAGFGRFGRRVTASWFPSIFPRRSPARSREILNETRFATELPERSSPPAASNQHAKSMQNLATLYQNSDEESVQNLVKIVPAVLEDHERS